MEKMVYTRETARTYKEQVQKICDYPELCCSHKARTSIRNPRPGLT